MTTFASICILITSFCGGWWVNEFAHAYFDNRKAKLNEEMHQHKLLDTKADIVEEIIDQINFQMSQTNEPERAEGLYISSRIVSSTWYNQKKPIEKKIAQLKSERERNNDGKKRS